MSTLSPVLSVVWLLVAGA